MGTSSSKSTDSQLPGAFQLFKPSIDALSLNIVTWIQIIFVPLAAIIVWGLITALFAGAKLSILAWIFAAVLVLVCIAYGLLSAPMYLVLQLRSAQGKKMDWKSVLSEGRHYLWRVWGMSIVVGLLILGGLVLLVVPGLYMIRRYFLSSYILVDTDGKVFDSMRASTEMSLRDKHAIWTVIGVQFLIGLVGIVPLIGSPASFVGSILYYFAPAIRYEEIKKLPAVVKN